VRIKQWTAATVFLTLTQTGFAGDPESGKSIAATCVACHGSDGLSVIDGYPNLAGQNEAYLVSALNAYKAGQRTGANAGIMQSQVGMLSDEDIANLAAYFATLPPTGGNP
jgi:cytochrome c553